MKIDIHELAAKELNEGIEWYENQSIGLGKRFRKAVVEQMRKIKGNPSWFLVEAENVFKAYVPKFPYKILFSIEKDQIIVWAIAHLHRQPWYWQFRKG